MTQIVIFGWKTNHLATLTCSKKVVHKLAASFTAKYVRLYFCHLCICMYIHRMLIVQD
jgi:hypothetical protein